MKFVSPVKSIIPPQGACGTMKQIQNNIVYPVLMTALLVEQILISLDRTVSQNSCTVSFLILSDKICLLML